MTPSRFLAFLAALGLGLLAALGMGAGAADAQAPQGPVSCSVELNGNNALIRITPAAPIGTYSIYRMGRAIPTDDTDFLVNQTGESAHFDERVPLTGSTLHYSVLRSPGERRTYCGSIVPDLGTCSVRLGAGDPVIGWSNRFRATALYRNGATIEAAPGDETSTILGNVFGYQYRDEAAGYVKGTYHYSVEWDNGTRTYCGSVKPAGRTITCSVRLAGQMPVIETPQFFTASAPQRPVLWRNGRQVAVSPYFAQVDDGKNGVLDLYYRPNAVNHYSIQWIQGDGTRSARQYCGSVVPPTPSPGTVEQLENWRKFFARINRG